MSWGERFVVIAFALAWMVLGCALCEHSDRQRRPCGLCGVPRRRGHSPTCPIRSIRAGRLH